LNGANIPARELIDEPTNNRPGRGAQERRGREDHHGELHIFGLETVCHGASCDCEKSTSSDAVEEAAHQQGLDVLGHGAGNEPDEEEEEGGNVDRPATVELDKLSVLSRVMVGLIILRPIRHTSDNGARNMGPTANPSTNNERPKVAISREQSNSFMSCPYVVVYTDDVKVLARMSTAALTPPLESTYTQKQVKVVMKIDVHFCARLKFRGNSLSSGPFHRTSNGSVLVLVLSAVAVRVVPSFSSSSPPSSSSGWYIEKPSVTADLVRAICDLERLTDRLVPADGTG
jgi:hypothetical protein